MTDAKPRFLRAVPLLPAPDIEAACTFYRTRLGFEVSFQYEDYAGLSRAGIDIHLWKCEDLRLPTQSSCRIAVRGIQALYRELEAAGLIHPNGRLEEKPWGFLEFTAVDGCGNSLVFAERLPPEA